MEEQRVEVKEGELLTLDWADLGKEAGDVVFVTCSGESSGSSASNQTGDSSWVSVSTVIQYDILTFLEPRFLFRSPKTWLCRELKLKKKKITKNQRKLKMLMTTVMMKKRMIKITFEI